MTRSALVLFLLAFLLAACSGRYKAPPAVPNVPLPSGAALKPWDPQHPGLARPMGIAQMNGKAYVALGNYDAAYTPRGPGLLAAFLPSDGQVTLIDLGGSGGKECISRGWVRTGGDRIYVTCSGDFNTGGGTAVVEVDPSGSGTVTHRFATSTSPAGVAATATRVWYGDAFAGAVYPLDRATLTAAGPAVPITCPTSGTYQTVNDLAIIGGDLYAVCSNSVGGMLNRLDANTGASKGTADVGPVAAAIAETGDGRIALVSGIDNKLRLVSISGSQLTASTAYTFGGQTSTLQDVRALDQFVFTVASGNNAVHKISIATGTSATLVDEQSVGTCDSSGVCPTPWNILPLDDEQALVTNQGSSTIVAVKWAH
jgi:hypothetical protein